MNTIRTVVLSDKRNARFAVRLDFPLEDTRDQVRNGGPVTFQAWPLNGTASLNLMELLCPYEVDAAVIRDRHPDEPLGRVDGQHPRTGDPSPAVDFYQYAPTALAQRFTTEVVDQMLAEKPA